MALPKLETPTYELIQPSTGNKIRYRPFLVKEHKVLLTMSEASNDEVTRMVKEIVDVCTFKQLKINDIPHFDLEYIFMMLRAKSIGEIVEVSITCSNCGEKYDASFNIEDISVEKGEKVNDKILLTDRIGIQLKYPTFDDVVDVFESNDLKMVFGLIKNCMKGIFDENNFYDIKDQTEEEINEFLESLTKEQFEKIEKFFSEAPKLVQKFETKCTHCDSVNFSRIQGLQNFFV